MSNPTDLPDLPRAAMLVGANLESLRVLYTETQMREYAESALARRAKPEGEAPEPVRLRIGVSNNTDGVHMVVLRKRANGDTNIVMQSRIPEGDSYNHIVLLD